VVLPKRCADGPPESRVCRPRSATDCGRARCAKTPPAGVERGLLLGAGILGRLAHGWPSGMNGMDTEASAVDHPDPTIIDFVENSGLVPPGKYTRFERLPGGV
jgi:hypothetical protein